ncbi:glycoside hydrolase [bacterium]
MKCPLYIAFIWHHHQPYYKDPNKNVFTVPWVRFHSAKDYYDLVQILDDFPNIHQTFNIVPSLMKQINEYTQDNVKDVCQIISEKNTKDLDYEDKKFIIENFFAANSKTMIEPYPRYNELFQSLHHHKNIQTKIKAFTEKDFRDLVTWYNLTWIYPYFIEQDEKLKGLKDRGHTFTEQEKNYVLNKHMDIMKMVLPKYKQMQDKGRIEVSTTPFYHPIMPLLVDNYIAKVSQPDIKLPLEHFKNRHDVYMHLQKAKKYYEKVFKQHAKGFWPSEGAVSEDVLHIMMQENISWVASDQDILFKSFDTDISSESLYMPYKYKYAAKELSIVFRDKVLSDLIGFTYQNYKTKDAVNDFIGRLDAIRDKLKDSDEPHLVTIVLDGENCWEYYPNDGRDFLYGLYTELSNRDDLKTVTVSEYLNQFEITKTLNKIWPGSWINNNFHIWIGQDEDNRAWDFIYEARMALAEFEKKHKDDKYAEKIKKAWEEIYIAEGSDWWWWYGDDHFSLNDELFDELFRSHLIRVYQLIGLDVPEKFYKPIKKEKINE